MEYLVHRMCISDDVFNTWEDVIGNWSSHTKIKPAEILRKLEKQYVKIGDKYQLCPGQWPCVHINYCAYIKPGKYDSYSAKWDFHKVGMNRGFSEWRWRSTHMNYSVANQSLISWSGQTHVAHVDKCVIVWIKHCEKILC